MNVIACVDGANISNTSCGFADTGGNRYFLPRSCFTNFDREETLYFYVEINTESGYAAVKMENNYPTPSYNAFRKLVGRLVYDDDKYILSQEHHGAIGENYHLTLLGVVDVR